MLMYWEQGFRMSSKQESLHEPSTSDGKSARDKFETWNALPLNERLDRVGASVQKVKDAPYALANYKLEPKFEVGDPVAVCYQGYYYHAVIVKHEEPYSCTDLNKKIPLYLLKYPGWGDKYGTVNQELVVEYDMIGTTKHTVAHELLYAHYWNKAKLLDKKAKKHKSLFELPPRTLEKLESKWRNQIKEDNPDQDTSFAQWIGLKGVEDSISAGSSSNATH